MTPAHRGERIGLPGNAPTEIEAHTRGHVVFLARARQPIRATGQTWTPHTSSELVVIADYSLLMMPDTLAAASTGRIGLLPAAPHLAAIDLAYLWERIPAHSQLSVTKADVTSLQPLLRARAEVSDAADASLELLQSYLAPVSREYLEALAPGGDITAATLRVLHDYPTPSSLGSIGTRQLAQMLGVMLPTGSQQIIDRLQSLRKRSMETQYGAGGYRDLQAETAKRMIPPTIEHHLLFVEQRNRLDTLLYATVAAENSVPSHQHAQPQSISLLDLPLPVDHQLLDTADPTELVALATAVFARRQSPQRQPSADYQEFQRIRAGMKALGLPLPMADALRIEIFGQLLALSAGEVVDAISHRAACDALVNDATSWLDVPQDQAASLRADAAMAMAIVEVCVIDTLEGFPSLRFAVESGASAYATPELFAEASGLFTLILALYGEHGDYPIALEIMRTVVERHQQHGACRAGADLTDLFVEGMRPDTPPERLQELWASADRHSRRTPYRSFFNYIMMLSSYVSKDIETGLLNFKEIQSDGLWQRYNPRFYRLARLSRTMLLASGGDFGTARRELADFRREAPLAPEDSAEPLIARYTELRLDLAAGRHAEALVETAQDGALGDRNLVGAQMRRYIPLSLVIQGTALKREGSTQRAGEAFRRATHVAVVRGEWLTLLAGETAEYRAWLTGLATEELPPGLTPEARSAVLQRPILIDHTLPQLTPQQTRILRLLAEGRSVQSIAAKLHVTANTIKSHLQRLYERLEVRSREQAVTHAAAYGLID